MRKLNNENTSKEDLRWPSGFSAITTCVLRPGPVDRLTGPCHRQYYIASAGHITIRDPVDPDTFLMNPFGKHFSLMTASDIVRVDHTGNVLDGGKPNRRYVNRAGFLIHAAVHEARPEMNAVCHSHAPYSKAWCSFNHQLPLLTQDSAAFYDALAIDKEFSGVALDPDEGRRIAAALGQKQAALLGVSVWSCNFFFCAVRLMACQNHGSITVGETIESTMSFFVKLEKECQVALLAYSAAASPNSPFKPKVLDDVTAKFTKEGEGSEEANYFDGLPYFDHQEELSYKGAGGPYDL